MNKLILLFGVLICLLAVQARHYVDKNEQDSLQEEDTLRPKDHISHHRRRRQSSYGYDYPPPSYSYPYSRDDYLRRIQQNYLRRTPPSPHLTFVEDSNQIWGFLPPVEKKEDYNGGARSISFEPVVSKQIMKRPSPRVEHGSEQVSIKAPKFVKNTLPVLGLPSQSSPSISSLPGMCNAAILSCCSSSRNPMQQKKCFANIGCATTYADGNGCNQESIQKAIKSFQAAYAPL